MARYLAYTSPARGHLYPLVSTLDVLRARGHSVVVRTLASQVGLMRERGFDAAAIDPAIEELEHDDWKARTPVGANKRVLRTFLRRAKLEIPDIRKAIDDVQPDALIIDISASGAAAVAESGSLPWAQYLPYFTPIRSVDAPPFGLGLQPRHDWRGRLRDAIVERIALRPLMRESIAQHNAMRASVRAPALGNMTDLYSRAPVFLYYTAEPFEYPRRDWPANYRLVGPGLWEPPSEPPAWLAAIDRPLVLVSCSSEYQNDRRLVDTTLRALAEEEVFVVATLAGNDPAALDVPRNARVERYVAHAPLLQRASCVVCHGGMGITQKALANGVPVCVVPFGRDQLEVAGHVKAAGTGAVLQPLLLNPKRLRTAVHEATGKLRQAQQLAAAIARAGGPTAAADHLESLLHGRPPSGSVAVVQSRQEHARLITER
jgi:MGT family glycosyltransferase